MDRLNILNKVGMLTDEDRKQPLEHGCEFFTFKTCIDLSEPIIVTAYGNQGMQSLQNYSADVASFICWWTNTVWKDLNGFPGFSHVKFVPQDFILIDQTKDGQDKQS